MSRTTYPWGWEVVQQHCVWNELKDKLFENTVPLWPWEPLSRTPPEEQILIKWVFTFLSVYLKVYYFSAAWHYWILIKYQNSQFYGTILWIPNSIFLNIRVTFYPQCSNFEIKLVYEYYIILDSVCCFCLYKNHSNGSSFWNKKNWCIGIQAFIYIGLISHNI